MRFDYFDKVIRSAAILTTSYVAGTDIEEVYDRNQLIILVDFTKGSLTSAELKIEFSPDGTNWFQETATSVTGGTISESLAEHALTATGKYRISVPINDRKIRISVKGTGTVTSSSIAVKAIIGRV